MSQYSILGRVIGDEVRQTAILQGTQGQVLISDLTNINGFSFSTLPAPPATPNLSTVLTAGNSSSNSILLQDATTPSLLNTSYSSNGFTATDGTGTPQYTNTTASGSITLQRSDGYTLDASPSEMSLTQPNGTTTLSSPSQSLEFDSPIAQNSASYAITQTQINYNNGESQIALTAQTSPSIFIGRNNLLNTATFTPDDVSVVAGGSGSSATWANIISATNSGTPTLSAVLSVGNNATDSINLNNLGTGSNYIRLLPNAGANDPQITITDGTTTNTINKNGYTTRNTNADLTHYLNFSDNSATGTGAIQKSASLFCNPNLGRISATTFVGALTGIATSATNIGITDTNAATTYYPTFVSTDGTTGVFIDKTTGPMTYVPSTGTLTAQTFSGALNGLAAQATSVTTTSDNTATTCYIPFTKSAAGTGKSLYVDDVTGPLTYTPSTSTLTATTFSGALSGNASTATTSTNATNVATTAVSASASYYPTFVSATSGNNAISVDADLTYNPSTNVLTGVSFVSSASSSTNTITSNQIAVANAGGSFTINQGSFTGSPTSGAYVFNGASGLRLQYNGTNNLFTTTNAVQATLLTSQGTATYSSPTLTLVTTASDPYPTMYTNLITFSGSTTAQTISAITVPANMPLNGMYMVYINNSNTSAGAITVNATGFGSTIKTTYTTAVVIPVAGYALGTLTKVGASTYIWSINLVA